MELNVGRGLEPIDALSGQMQRCIKGLHQSFLDGAVRRAPRHQLAGNSNDGCHNINVPKCPWPLRSISDKARETDA